MAQFHRNITSFRWSINNYQQQCMDAYPEIRSGNFSLNFHSSVQFELVINFLTALDFSSTFNLVLKEISSEENEKPLELDIKFWMENKFGGVFCNRTIHKQIFKQVDEECSFEIKSTDINWHMLEEVWNDHEPLVVCCQLAELDENHLFLTSTPINKKLSQKLSQGLWALYKEEEAHDAIIKVNKSEFKILKSVFMSQSDVFKEMFKKANSKHKQDSISKLTLKDVDEQTMKSLIKWLYIGEIESESNIEFLFVAACKYKIDLLKIFCSDKLTDTINNENAFLRFFLANIHNDDKLKENASKELDKLSKTALANCLTSTAWIEFMRKNPETSEMAASLIREKLSK